MVENPSWLVVLPQTLAFLAYVGDCFNAYSYQIYVPASALTFDAQLDSWAISHTMTAVVMAALIFW